MKLKLVLVMLSAGCLCSFILIYRCTHRPIKFFSAPLFEIFSYETVTKGVISGFVTSPDLEMIKEGKIVVTTSSGTNEILVDKYGRFWDFVGTLDIQSIAIEINGLEYRSNDRLTVKGLFLGIIIKPHNPENLANPRQFALRPSEMAP